MKTLWTLFAAGCARAVEILPPTGDLGIGEVTSRWVDESREDTIGAGPRAVGVQVWYPAEPPPDAEPAAYVPELGALRPALEGIEERLFRHVEVHAVLDAPPLAEPAAWPVVVLSHGDDRIGAEYTSLTEELVSHGYVVVAVDHPHDARAALDAAGDPVAYAEDAWPALPPVGDDGLPVPGSAYAVHYRERTDVRVADARFALDTLAADGVGALSPARFDLSRVAFVGHSVGGVAAGSFCRDEPRAAACVNLDGESPDGPLYLDEAGGAFAPPYLMITKSFAPTDEQIAGWGLTREEWEANRAAWIDGFFGAVEGGSWRVELAGATHESFTDEVAVLAALQGDDPTAAELHLQRVRDYVRAFLDRTLLGAPSTALDEAPPAGVTVEKWPPA